MALRERFTEVYQFNHWCDPETASGPGSRRDSHSVAAALAALRIVAQNYEISSMNDIPCGDFNWVDQFLSEFPKIAYRGFDIVKPLIEQNRHRFPQFEFTVLDITSEIPPKTDLIFCKDLLNHLTYSDIVRAIENMKASGSTYLFATNNFGFENVELPVNEGGSSRLLDLTAAPLNYPVPLWHTNYLGLWKLADLRPPQTLTQGDKPVVGGFTNLPLKRSVELKERFTEVFLFNHWCDPETVSGAGSRRDAPCVAASLVALKIVIQDYAINSINDIPCGDFNWIDQFLSEFPKIGYSGFDIVEPLIDRNRQRFPQFEFTVLDITSEIPPKADLIFCKDLLNHLTYGDIVRAIENMKASGSAYLLATNNFGFENVELPFNEGGASRILDLTAAPLNYPVPLWHTNYLGLWKLADLHPPQTLTQRDKSVAGGITNRPLKAHDHGLRPRIISIMKLMQPEDVVDSAPYVRIGQTNDGGYIMYEPALSGSIAYSFGISNDVSWDSDMAKRGFDIYMYDHTIDALPHKDDRFHWTRQGILGSGETATLKTLAHFLKENGHSDRSNMVMKIDVEGYEWDVFSEIEDDILCKFQQIVVEFHSFDYVDNDELFQKMQKSLSRLHRLFSPVHVHANNYCDIAVIGNVPIAPVLEVTYIRRSSFKTIPSKRIFPTPLDQPNNPNVPDIHLGNFIFG